MGNRRGKGQGRGKGEGKGRGKSKVAVKNGRASVGTWRCSFLSGMAKPLMIDPKISSNSATLYKSKDIERKHFF